MLCVGFPAGLRFHDLFRFTSSNHPFLSPFRRHRGFHMQTCAGDTPKRGAQRAQDLFRVCLEVGPWETMSVRKATQFSRCTIFFLCPPFALFSPLPIGTSLQQLRWSLVIICGGQVGLGLSLNSPDKLPSSGTRHTSAAFPRVALQSPVPYDGDMFRGTCWQGILSLWDKPPSLHK